MKVGARTLTVADPRSGEAFPVWVLYPTQDDPVQVTVGAHGFAMRLAPEAVPAQGRHALVVFSHGGGSSPFVYRGLAAALAAAGHVVALPEHPGDHRGDRSRSDSVRNLQDRPRHLRLVVDALRADAALGPRLRGPGHIAAGHSLGGYTALAAAGGRPWTRERERVEVEHDPRIAALLLLAPAAAFFLAPHALQDLDLPMFVMTAGSDTLTPPSLGEAIVSAVRDPSRVQHETVPLAGHHAFLSPFPEALRRPDFPPALDPPGFDREDFHRRRLFPRALAFVERIAKTLA
jgi:predicted dienelactone hydrolase